MKLSEEDVREVWLTFHRLMESQFDKQFFGGTITDSVKAAQDLMNVGKVVLVELIEARKKLIAASERAAIAAEE